MPTEPDDPTTLTVAFSASADDADGDGDGLPWFAHAYSAWVAGAEARGWTIEWSSHDYTLVDPDADETSTCAAVVIGGRCFLLTRVESTIVAARSLAPPPDIDGLATAT